MAKYINKDTLVAELEKLYNLEYNDDANLSCGKKIMLRNILRFLDTLDVKDVDLIDRKPDWSPSKKQMESLRDLLKYNIGVFDYQKFMEVKSLYDDLTKMVDYKIEW